MTPEAARLQCLRLAQENASLDGGKKGADGILETAKKWAEFVIGPKVVESASARNRGADDHLAKKPGAR